ncbi:Cell division control protein 14 [Golovinomyces cichoracearum]|uniref:Cell division control protein 14 n=1 Tax=Golovinomyces cichoracearum TaxID=62708 RepID=A0A420J3W8_9PEZI|nr:Cell division control protein 14 [Golovinomyces cichoracearum]
METLLSTSFDNLSSYDQMKIRKGLRQVEGLLAQICLSPSTAVNRRSKIDMEKERPPKKRLEELVHDPAFREFFKLQDGFEWNVALRLVNTLDRLLSKSQGGQNDLLVIQTLDLIQGVLMLHPSSRTLFSRELNMNHLLDLLEPINCPAIQSATIITLVCALIETPQNTRTFENLDGLFICTSLFKSRETSREVKLKLVEFLYFYLMPEFPCVPPNSKTLAPELPKHNPSKLGGNLERNDANEREDNKNKDEFTRSIEEKQALLGRYLNSVEDLVADLRESAPFEGVSV